MDLDVLAARVREREERLREARTAEEWSALAAEAEWLHAQIRQARQEITDRLAALDHQRMHLDRLRQTLGPPPSRSGLLNVRG